MRRLRKHSNLKGVKLLIEKQRLKKRKKYLPSLENLSHRGRIKRLNKKRRNRRCKWKNRLRQENSQRIKMKKR